MSCSNAPRATGRMTRQSSAQMSGRADGAPRGARPRSAASIALWLAAAVLALPSAAARADESRQLEILPADLTLFGPEGRQRVVAQWVRGGLFAAQADEVQWTTSDESVVRVEDGVLHPVGDGLALLTARVGSQVATAGVTVTGQDVPNVWSFRNHVESVLSKLGCNSGACHGAQAGQNGFRLTLFGFDVDADYSYLTRQARGRRIVPEDPARSLILTKPTGMVPHKGGVRLDPDSLEYRVLAEWIAQGTPPPSDADPELTRLEVWPENSRQTVDGQQQLVVRAHFSDGRVEDVTRWAKFTSVHSSVAAVDDEGLVTVRGPGEGAIHVWYLNENEMAFVSVPYPHPLDASVFAASDRQNFIDEHVLGKLEGLNLPPSPPASDAAFLRRAYLDTVGRLPRADEIERLLADEAPDKRARVVDELLSLPEFVDYWAYKWSDLLLVNGERLGGAGAKAYYGWIRQQVADGTPWDELVRQLLTASGSTLDNGAANFFALHESPEEIAENVSQAFMGLALNCAKCHNHPLEKWTNDQYFGMANLFARIRTKSGGEGERVVFVDARGELIQPSTGRAQPPRPLDAPPLEFSDPGRREYLAEWLTSPDNPYFTRAIVNRVWANFFGVGLVEKVDDLRRSNPASNEQLLDAAAEFLVENQFDLKQLMRVILTSAAYQRSSVPREENVMDERYYARYYPRRLQAEVLLDAIAQVTGVPSEFPEYPAGTRAIQLPDSNVDSYFLSAFGRPERVITCECERSDEPSMTQVLHLYNGNTLNDKLAHDDNRISRLLAEGASDQEIIEDLFLSALARRPAPHELERLLELMGDEQADRRRLLEDLYWSVLSSREFLFNH